MKEFENVIYLDMQKTGSTTIMAVLSSLLDEQHKQEKPHLALPKTFDRAKLFFVSIREPLSLYISLFNFGAGNRRGTLFSLIKREGRSDLFDPSPAGFEQWLRFVLNPQNAKALKNSYLHSGLADTIGLLSYRLLYLSVPQSVTRMCSGKFHNVAGVKELFQRRVFEDYVRTENLGEDLFAFLSHNSDRMKLRRPLTTANEMIARVPVKNASRKVPGLTPQSVSPELRQLVREREWLIYEAFGYDTYANGRPPRLIEYPETIDPKSWSAIGSRPPRGERKAAHKVARLERYKARLARKEQKARPPFADR